MGMSHCLPKLTALRQRGAAARAISQPPSGYARERFGESLTYTILCGLKLTCERRANGENGSDSPDNEMV